MNNSTLANSSCPLLGDKNIIKGLKYKWLDQNIFVDVDTWIYPHVAIPKYPSTELSRLVKKVVMEGSFTTLLQIARAVARSALSENDYISAVSVSVKVENPKEAEADSTDFWGADVFRFKGNDNI
ncbi:unnamed protein product [Cuscuta epithymum]|uniref:Uncharacterized protein n=1 Tax=Cuscuta epithymum TaxID=186058 RepID=A0AAV0FME0_9ASTE|nr:unnamed protein product [Cuscuta epithymum]